MLAQFILQILVYIYWKLPLFLPEFLDVSAAVFKPAGIPEQGAITEARLQCSEIYRGFQSRGSGNEDTCIWSVFVFVILV